MPILNRVGLTRYAALLAMLLANCVAHGQDLEPRRWTYMPTGVNVLALGAGYLEGDIFFNPVLQLQDVNVRTASAGLVYLRTFGFLGKSARLDFRQPYVNGHWEGLLQGEPASTRRSGFSDPRVRLSVLLYGAPAMTMQEFATSEKSNTVIGAAIGVKIPVGQYYEDRFINLGDNRWVIRPQVGITHTRKKWTYELTTSVFWYADNDEFFDGSKLENDPLFTLQGHLIYTFRPGLWVSLSTAYGNGADTLLNGLPIDMKVDNWLAALSLGVPINRQQGLKFAWLSSRTQTNTGADLDNFSIAWSWMFQ